MSASRLRSAAPATRTESGFVAKVVSAGRLTAPSYDLGRPIASGGMATVFLARRRSEAGRDIVAVKRLHPSLSPDPRFSRRMLDEARAASRVRHPNVVALLDVIVGGEPVMLVFEHVLGVTVGQLLRGEGERRALPIGVACAIVADVLRGLQAAHIATDEAGVSLELVHRDVSPQNVLVGVDGTARIIDFGIAKARGRAEVTRSTGIRGKAAYIAPERFIGEPTDHRVDIWSAGVLLWEMCTGSKLFDGEDPVAVARQVCFSTIPSCGYPAVDRILTRALARDLEARYATAEAMARALEESVLLAPESAIAAEVHSRCAAQVREHEQAVRELTMGIVGKRANPISIATPLAIPPESLLVPPLAGPRIGDGEGEVPAPPRPEEPLQAITPLDELTRDAVPLGYSPRTVGLALVLALVLFSLAGALAVFAR